MLELCFNLIELGFNLIELLGDSIDFFGGPYAILFFYLVQL